MFYKSSPVHILHTSPVHVLQIHLLQIHVFIQIKSGPCFTNPCFTNPCFLQIQSMFYKSNPVHVLQYALFACQAKCLHSRSDKRIPFFVVLCDNFSPFSISKDQGSGTLSCMSAFRLLWYSRPQRRPIRLRVNQHSMRNDNCTSKNCFTNNS